MGNEQESNVEEDIPAYKASLVSEFRLVDASNDDEAASHGALSEYPFFNENEELRKKMIFKSKE